MAFFCGNPQIIGAELHDLACCFSASTNSEKNHAKVAMGAEGGRPVVEGRRSLPPGTCRLLRCRCAVKDDASTPVWAKIHLQHAG